MQVCGPTGTYGSCGCPDAGSAMDAPGADAPDAPDAADLGAPPDLGALDAGSDVTPTPDLAVDAADAALDATTPGDVACSAGRTRCGGVCVDTRTSTDHCGACDARCAPPNGAGVCLNGSCEVGACTSPFRDCDATGANGCKTDTRTDPSHCGGCGRACAAGETCAAGACAGPACAAGFGNCDGMAPNGCETNTQTSLAHCGTSGHACPSGPHSTPTGAAGACGLRCSLDWADCDGDPLNGCEALLAGDRLNCGACGNLCADGQTCVGTCVRGPTCVSDSVRCNVAGTAVERCVGGAWTTSRTCGLSAGDDLVGFCADNTCRRGDGGMTSGCGASTCTTIDDCYRQGWGTCVAGQCNRRGILACGAPSDCLPWIISG